MPADKHKSLVLDAAVVFAFVSALASVFGWSYERGYARGFELPKRLLAFTFQDGLLAFLNVVGAGFWALPIAVVFATLGLSVLGWKWVAPTRVGRRIAGVMFVESRVHRSAAEGVLFRVGYAICLAFSLILLVFGMIFWSERLGKRDGERQAALARGEILKGLDRPNIVNVTYMVGDRVMKTSGVIVFSKANEVAVYTASGPLVIARDRLIQVDRLAPD